MSVDTVFTVPKDRQSVTIHLDKGVMLAGEIFLEYISDDLSVHQKVTAFIENSNSFFPLKVQATADTEFINKENVLSIEVDFPEDPDTAYFAFKLMQTIPVTVIFNHGQTISGALLAEVPQEKARLSDCLNVRQRFLSVRVGGKIFYINKNALQKVLHGEKSEDGLQFITLT